MRPKFPPPHHPAFAHFDPKEIERLAVDRAARDALPLATSALQQARHALADSVSGQPVVCLCKLSSGVVVLLRVTSSDVGAAGARVLWAFGLLDSETVAL